MIIWNLPESSALPSYDCNCRHGSWTTLSRWLQLRTQRCTKFLGGRIHKTKNMIILTSKRQEPNSAPALASQPAAGHSLSFYYFYCFTTLGWVLLVGLATESCSWIWLPRLMIPFIFQDENVWVYSLLKCHWTLCLAKPKEGSVIWLLHTSLKCIFSEPKAMG